MGKPESQKIDHLLDLKIGSSKIHRQISIKISEETFFFSIVYPTKENKILIGDNKKLTFYDLNELKEISTIYPNVETSEFFLCEADPHHPNLVLFTY